MEPSLAPTIGLCFEGKFNVIFLWCNKNREGLVRSYMHGCNSQWNGILHPIMPVKSGYHQESPPLVCWFQMFLTFVQHIEGYVDKCNKSMSEAINVTMIFINSEDRHKRNLLLWVTGYRTWKQTFDIRFVNNSTYREF